MCTPLRILAGRPTTLPGSSKIPVHSVTLGLGKSSLRAVSAAHGRDVVLYHSGCACVKLILTFDIRKQVCYILTSAARCPVSSLVRHV